MTTAETNTVHKDVASAAQDLLAYCEKRDFAGYDPYDALNSPLLRLVSLGMKWPRIAVTQAVKKLPWNLRPLFLIPRGHNPKGLGLFLWSCAKLYAVDPKPEYLERIDHLLDLLETVKGHPEHGVGWGYNFPWQSRAFYVPRGTPTIVNTSFVTHALLDTYEITGNERALQMALPVKEFLLNDLHRTGNDEEFCFAYTPIDQLIVHNANLLGASVLIRLHQVEPDERARAAALASLAYSMNRQREDGSWWYADTDYQQWIDSFHTGFNLQCIEYILKAGEGESYREGFEKGVKYYAENFFLEDGTAKYFHDRTYPIDVHSYAQAMVFFSEQGSRYSELVDRVAGKFLETFRDSSGYFYFQIKPGHVIKIPYMRWSQSWSLHALTHYLVQNPESA